MKPLSELKMDITPEESGFWEEDVKESIKNFTEEIRKELLYITDDVINDWSYIEKRYHEKLDELKLKHFGEDLK